MKYLTKKVYLLLGIFLLLNSCFALATQTYTLDPQHSFIQWHVSHFGFSNPSGKWMVHGTLSFDKNNIKNSKVEATINMANIVTGIPELDKHLKGTLFFDVDHFPTATFVSHKIEAIDQTLKKVHGVLTVHGISKEIILNVRLNKIGINPVTEKETIGFTANTTLLRSNFGISGLLPGVGDEVLLEIEIEAYKN